MRDLRKLGALGADERRLLALSVAVLPGIVAGLRLFGFRRVHAALARWPADGRSRPGRRPDDERARVLAVARVAGIAAGRGPVRATCLRRSLLIWWMLRREGIETTLRIGVRRDGDKFFAHAWVEHRGVPVGEADDPGTRYVPFDRDFGAAVEAGP